MLDIKFIRENSEVVRMAIKNKNIPLDLSALLLLDTQRRETITEIDLLRQERNEIAGKLKDSVSRGDELIQMGKALKEAIKMKEEELSRFEKKYQELMWLTPTIPSGDTPVGHDETGNVERKRWGELPRFDFPFRDHRALAKMHDWVDFERGVKIAGFRGYFLKGQGALLHMKLMLFVMEQLVLKGFTPMIPPTLVKESVLWGTGYFPFGVGDNYEVNNVSEEETGELMKEKQFLAGTAEVGIGGYYTDEVLREEDLPLKFAGFSPCYRREVGSYGRDTKGLYRIHEFMKVEQFIICQNDYAISEQYHQELLKNSEEILQTLQIPYRVIQLCTGDMGAGKYKMYDIESWMPSRNAYGETHSCSNLGEWQARRLNIRYKTKTGEIHYVHTLNNTALASPRILIPLLELNQDSFGKISLPSVLGIVPFAPKHV